MEKDNSITIILVIMIILVIISSAFIILKIYDSNNQKEERKMVEIKTDISVSEDKDNDKENTVNMTETEEEKEKDTKFEIGGPYYKNNKSPVSNIENFSKTIKHQEKIGGGTTQCWYPKDWNSSGYVYKSGVRIYDEFFNMEVESGITYNEFINLATKTIKNNTKSYWECYEGDSDNEYYTEKLNINGEEYKIIKVISVSQYSNKAKTYVYFFPLQKDNVLYFLMAEVEEKSNTEENLEIVKKIFSSYCVL